MILPALIPKKLISLIFFSVSECNDGNEINQHTGMPFSFSEYLANDEVNELPLLTCDDLMEITRLKELALNKSTTN